MEKLFWGIYSQYYDVIASLYSYQEMLQDIVFQLPTVVSSKILDVCCGTGNIVPILTEHGHTSDYIGIDFSKEMLKRANSKYGSLPNVKFQQADVNIKLPFPDQYFDIVLCVNALYITQNPTATVQEFRRITKSSGMIIISTPSQKAGIIVHLIRHIQEKGIFSLLPKILPLLLAAISNVIIVRQGQARTYHFFTKQELQVLLQSDDIQATYAGQNWLVKILNK